MTIKEIFDFSKSNEKNINYLIDDIKKHLVIPFVGAGLSSAIYPTWRNLISELVSGIDNKEDFENVNEQLDKDNFEEAAESIYKVLGKKTLFNRLRRIHSDDEIDYKGGLDILRSEAVWTLPYIFNGNMITTNYDKIIEKVYEANQKSLRIAIPENGVMLNRAQQDPSKPILFKMHGDFESEVENIVFTKDSYVKNYKMGTPLVAEFQAFIKSRKLLFLGCSLSKDRTIDVMTKVCTKNPALEHYAIIGCLKAQS